MVSNWTQAKELKRSFEDAEKAAKAAAAKAAAVNTKSHCKKDKEEHFQAKAKEKAEEKVHTKDKEPLKCHGCGKAWLPSHHEKYAKLKARHDLQSQAAHPSTREP